MELSKFIESTLAGITEGIANSNKYCSKFGAKICPAGLKFTHTDAADQGYMNTGEVVHYVSFDLSVTESDGVKASAGGKISVIASIFSISGNGEASMKNEALNKIKFKIPIVYPNH